MHHHHEHHVPGALVAGAVTLVSVVSIGAAIKPLCPTDLCRQSLGYISENRAPTPTTEQPGGPAPVVIHAAGTALASTSVEPFVFRDWSA